MENRIAKGNVALIEKCVMSSIGMKSLFDAFPDCQYKLHIFPTQSAFQKAMLSTPFPSLFFHFLRCGKIAGWGWLIWRNWL